MPLEVVHADERLVVDPGQRLGEVDADEQRAGEARAVRDGDGVDVAPADRRRPPTPRRGTGTIQRRWARAATSGTIPPDGAWSATCEATTLLRIAPAALDRARSPVSSHDDSIDEQERPAHASSSSVERRRRSGRSAPAPRRAPRAARAIRSRIAGSSSGSRRHDQRVLVVVAVVARPQPDRPEAVLLVQPARRQVRQADLERRLVRAAVDGDVEEREQQPLADRAAGARRDGRRRS